MTAGIYARISLGEAIAGQLASCHALAEQRGWTDCVEYTDGQDARHGSRGRQPAFERLIADIRSGRITAVVAYSPDRLWRRPAERDAFKAVVAATGIEVVTVT